MEDLILTEKFGKQVKTLLVNCLAKGIVMVPYASLRHPIEQARLWKQSRSIEEVENKLADLKRSGANYLSFCLESALHQIGPHVTNAIPGCSWHQWGEAIDCYWELDGKRTWDIEKKVNGLNGYDVYASEAMKLQLNAGLFWQNIKDAVHVQLRKEATPMNIYSLLEIDQIMKRTFENIAV